MGMLSTMKAGWCGFATKNEDFYRYSYSHQLKEHNRRTVGGPASFPSPSIFSLEGESLLK